MHMNGKTAPMLLAAIVLASTLFSSFAFARQTECGNGLCETGELYSCQKDCGSPVEEVSAGSVQTATGSVPPKALQLPIVFGSILVVLLVIAGYAANATGKPTLHWKKTHGRSLKRK